MTPEEVHRTVEFLIQHAATFSAQMDELKLRQEDFAHRQEHDHKYLVDLTQQTARFESWAAEVMAIESRRLDKHDRLQDDAKTFQNEALRLLRRILDRLPPAEQ